MDCLVLPAIPSRKEPVGRLERRYRRKRRAVTRRSLRSPGGASSPERKAAVARRGRAVQGGRYARGVPATRAHLLLDDRELAQAGRRGRSGGARAKKAGAEAGCLGTTNPAAGARQRSSAPQTRARRIDHRRPKKLCVALGLPTADDTSGDA